VPMILGPDGKRLSKRHGATAVGEYAGMGILPAAMVNFLALLGWSPGTDEEVFTTDELSARFSLEAINRKSAIFDPQKLEWMNAQHLNRIPATELADTVARDLDEAGLPGTATLRERPEWFHALIELMKPRARVLQDLARRAVPYLAEQVEYEADAVAKHWKQPEQVAQRLRLLADRFRAAEWTESGLEEALRGAADEIGVAAGKLIHPLRVALTGVAVGPGIFEVAVQVGRERSLRRIEEALHHLANGFA